MHLLPKECAGPISAVSVDFSSVSIVTRHVDFDCQKHLFPSCFPKTAWVLVLCLGSVPGTSELCRASRKVAYVCTPFSLLSLEGPALDLLELEEKSVVFSLCIFASTRAASFWIYECQRFFFFFFNCTSDIFKQECSSNQFNEPAMHFLNPSFHESDGNGILKELIEKYEPL